MSTRSLNYTTSTHARLGLISLLCRTSTTTYINTDGLPQTTTKPLLQSRQTVWARQPRAEYNPLSSTSTDIQLNRDQRSSYYEGLSHAIIQLTRNYDYDDFVPKPGPQCDNLGFPLWYTPPDRLYLDNPDEGEGLQDYIDNPDSWSPRAIEDLERELAKDHRYTANATFVRLYPKLQGRGYSHLSLRLPDDVRIYLVGLLAYYSIPPCPFRRSDSNLTSQVSWVLEVIGSQHLVPKSEITVSSGKGISEGAHIVTLQQLVNEPNPRKAAAAAVRSKSKGTGKHKYGNHSQTPLLNYFDTKQKPPNMTKLDTWTTADIEWANTHDLKDFALEAQQLQGLVSNTRQLSDLTPGPGLDSLGVREMAQRRWATLTPSQQPNLEVSNNFCPLPHYIYKGLNILEPILIAHYQHYIAKPPISFANLEPLAKNWRLPLYVLKSLITKEHVRRVLLLLTTSESNDLEPIKSKLPRKTVSRSKLMEALLK